MKNRLMILGSLEEFVHLAELAKKRGIYTIVCDGYQGSPAKKAADKFYDIPVTDIDGIAEICRAEKVNGIITSFSDLLFECMVKIAHKAGLKCYLTPKQLPYYRDKTVMKEMFARLGIPTQKSVCLDRNFTDDQLKSLTFPVVTKPVDKYGSRGIFVLDNPGRIHELFDTICSTSDLKKILVEEYHSGYEFNMMSWVLDGKVHVISIADREKTPVGPEEIPISTRNVYPSRLYDKVIAEAAGILQKIADFTGQKDGALSMQFFWSPGTGISVCEAAGRFLGYEHELIEISSGFSIEELLLDYVYDPDSLRRNLTSHDSRLKNTCAVLYFQGRNKTIKSQQKAREIAGREGVIFSQFFYEEGETVIHGSRPYVARYYVTGKDRLELDSRTEAIFRDISITDEDGSEILYSNRIPDYPR